MQGNREGRDPRVADLERLVAVGAGYVRAMEEQGEELIVVCDRDGRCLFAAGATAAVIGLEPSELVGMDMLDPPADSTREPLVEFIRAALDGTAPVGPNTLAYPDARGAVRWMELIAVNMLDDPAVGGVVFKCREVTRREIAEERHVEALGELRRMTEEMRRRALHDVLTGLPNRMLLLDRLDHALDRAHARKSCIAVLFIDLDRFNRINDTMGHDAGDLVLMEVARRLRSAIRPGDTVARLGGDEFTMVCEDLSSRAEARVLADRVAAAIATPIEIVDREVVLTVSVGVAIGPDGADSADSLLRDADLAMDRAKRGGRARVVVFDRGLRDQATDHLEIDQALRHALPRHELTVDYQPIVTLDDEAVVGIEALLRWHHPVWGLVLPDVFIPIAEESDLIGTLGRWVLDTACADTVALRAERPDLKVAVNLSPRQLAEPGVVDWVRGALERSGLEPSALVLEVTETALLDDVTSTVDVLVALRSVGVQIAIDDFGTGYSSLSYLAKLTVDEVKIDRSFTSGWGVDPGATAVVAGVVAMARWLGLHTVAEGIERPEQRAGLRSLGCDAGQGWLWSGPRAFDDFRAWLDERGHQGR